MLYFVYCQDLIAPEELAKTVTEQTESSQLGELAMSIAEQLLEKGREEGLEKGLEKGEFVGAIRMLQRLQKLPQSPKEELIQLSIEELKTLLEQLQKEQ